MIRNTILRTIVTSKNVNNIFQCKHLSYHNQKSVLLKRKDTKNPREGFESLYPSLISFMSENEDYKPVYERFLRSVEYNVFNRDYYNCFPAIDIYARLVPNEIHTDDTVRLAHTLDWILELLSTACLMIDDELDQSESRYYRKCWYTLPEIGSTSQCDTKMLEMVAYLLLKKHFSHMPCYKAILDKLTYTYYITAMGQASDVYTGENYNNNRKLSDHNIKAFNKMVYFKTYFFACRLTEYIVMDFLNYNYSTYNGIIDRFFVIHSRWQQIQNDIWDFFAKGKYRLGDKTDIVKGKLTWLIVTAQQYANPTQLKLLQDHYGKDNKESYETVQNIYLDIDLMKKYIDLKSHRIKEMAAGIEKIPNQAIKDSLYHIIDVTDKRDAVVISNMYAPRNDVNVHSMG
ncbi:hypothetical protein RN001_005256 [Aquatica leii]|uniref:Terpene synthase n=1 Tax=Aquatica leii TaxID=1421715 RepID=A0AAN7PBP5_9COLE|nr:hypothetical protein RN001_005256 [Aquatica leii]